MPHRFKMPTCVFFCKDDLPPVESAETSATSAAAPMMRTERILNVSLVASGMLRWFDAIDERNEGMLLRTNDVCRDVLLWLVFCVAGQV